MRFILVGVADDPESVLGTQGMRCTYRAQRFIHSLVLPGYLVYPIHLPACFFNSRSTQKNEKGIKFIETRQANKLYRTLDLSHEQNITSLLNEYSKVSKSGCVYANKFILHPLSDMLILEVKSHWAQWLCSEIVSIYIFVHSFIAFFFFK